MILINRFIKNISFVAAVLVISWVLSYNVLAWTEPSAVPPGGNTDAPINTGIVSQIKGGNLQVNALSTGALSGNALIVPAGNVGIGTLNPGARFQVDVLGIGDDMFRGLVNGDSKPRIVLGSNYDTQPSAIKFGRGGAFDPEITLALDTASASNPSILRIMNNKISGRQNIVSIDAPYNDPGESTLTLMRTDAGFTNSELVDVYNYDYGGGVASWGFNFIKNGAGAQFHPFVLSFQDQYGGPIVEALKILPDGRIGIGTTPQELLHISKTSGYTTFRLDSGAVQGQMFVDSLGANMYAGTKSNHPFVFETNNSEKMRIDIAGNVGIGTINPGEKLEVLGNVKFGGTAAIGNGVIASGQSSLAQGVDSVASGIAAIAMGYQSSATNFDSIALGYKAVSTGDSSFAVGNIATASGNKSVAIGPNAIASGLNSTSIGWASVASASAAVAIGGGNNAVADNAVAIGTSNDAAGVSSMAMGDHSIANGAGSYAIGYGVVANVDKSMVIGNGHLWGSGNTQTIVNNTPNSLMIGFDSNIPTLYVGPSAGIGTTGNVGIGTPNPGVKLQVTDGDAAISTQGNGLILKATDGANCYKVTVNNAGVLSTALVACP